MGPVDERDLNRVSEFVPWERRLRRTFDEGDHVPPQQWGDLDGLQAAGPAVEGEDRVPFAQVRQEQRARSSSRFD